MLEIIIHIVKNTMIINLYHTIIKLIRIDIMQKIPQSSTENIVEYNKIIDEKINKIINNKINNINLKNYLFGILPEKLVKIILGIFEGDDDNDRNGNIIDLLNIIDKILISNTEFTFNRDDSKTFKTLTQNVYPYFKNYLEINIKKIKKITDGYLSMILNFRIKLIILIKTLNKANTEKI